MKSIQFVTAIHGNETMPVLALSSMGVGQIVGNPKAVSEGKRFVEKDLNAAFGKGGKSYEEKRARNILKQVPKEKLVIDLHTFSAVSDPFAVIVDLKMADFASWLGFRNIVYMRHNIKKGHALINYRDGVSVEVGSHNEPKSFSRTIVLAELLKKGNLKKGKVVVHEVYDIIKKKGKYENFKLYKNSKESFYPVLAGEKAYDFYGLKSKIIEI